MGDILILDRVTNWQMIEKVISAIQAKTRITQVKNRPATYAGAAQYVYIYIYKRIYKIQIQIIPCPFVRICSSSVAPITVDLFHFRRPMEMSTEDLARHVTGNYHGTCALGICSCSVTPLTEAFPKPESGTWHDTSYK